MNLVQNAEPGLGAAWIMATVGSSAPHKKLSKKEITSISIPAACKMVGNPKESNILLRMAANLMYGLTLIHRHQVNYVFEDVSMVHLKLQKPVCFDRFFGDETSKPVRQRAHVPLQDCPHFTMRDFDNWEDEWFQDPLETHGRFKTIQECLEEYVSHAERADALDKLLDDILEQTMATIRGNESTFVEADFELDTNGEIVQNGQPVDFHGNSLLNLGFDDSFGAIELLNEELSKSLNRDHTSRDPHFSTTLALLRSTTLEHRRGKSKRKLLVVDSETVQSTEAFGYQLYMRQYQVESLLADQHTTKRPRKCQLWELLSEISWESPPLLNYARNVLLQPPAGVIPPSQLPLLLRHTTDQDVEIGRNIQRLADEIELARARGLELLDFEPDGFDSLDMSELQDLQDASFQFPLSQVESQGSVGRNLHRIALKLLGYIKNRSVEFGTSCDYNGRETDSQQYRKIEFARLFPIVPLGPTDVPVTKKLAAKSFGTILELATKNAIYILPGESPEVEKALILHWHDG